MALLHRPGPHLLALASEHAGAGLQVMRQPGGCAIGLAGRSAHRWRGAVGLIALAMAPASFAGPPLRSPSLRAEFQRLNPCPATGASRGPCPGWHIDHREALICGGRDELGNLQWLPIREHREKTRAEVKLCRPRPGRPGLLAMGKAAMMAA